MVSASTREAGSKRIAPRFLGVVVIAVAWGIGLAGSADADVDLYLEPQFGISGLDVEAKGVANTPGAATPLRGSDHDASPLIGLAVGVELPMNEIVPREWLEDFRLPTWPVRFDLEVAGLRDFDFRTVGSGASAANYFTQIKATTLVANAWLDIPLVTLWRPVQYVFGLGRQPLLRRWLEPANFYFGSGIGFAAIDIKGTDNVFTGNDDLIDFAWNVGAGINYSLTDRVSLSAGYRYLGLGAGAGSVKADLKMGSNPGGQSKFDLQIHEFRVGIRIALYSFRGVWR